MTANKSYQEWKAQGTHMTDLSHTKQQKETKTLYLKPIDKFKHQHNR